MIPNAPSTFTHFACALEGVRLLGLRLITAARP